MGTYDLPVSANSRCAFMHPPLERPAALCTDPIKRAALWPSSHVVLFNPQGQVFADPNGRPLALNGAQLDAVDGQRAVFLGIDADHAAWFAAQTTAPPCPAQATELMTVALSWPKTLVSLSAFARSLLIWIGQTRFCSRCGHSVQRHDNGFALRCLSCQQIFWPPVTPAIIVAVHDGEDRLLLGRQSSWTPKRYSVIAGFVEPGETCEHAVAREVFEETRILLESVDYVTSQPWPFPSNLMLGFMAQAKSGQIPVAQDELEDARWFDRAAIGTWLDDDPPKNASVMLPSPLALSRLLIEQWYRRSVSA